LFVSFLVSSAGGQPPLINNSIFSKTKEEREACFVEKRSGFGLCEILEKKVFFGGAVFT
jgi:hypothetical protein|tara:strand:+ start:204 stop:380 length:177 start_codon:yes stop_codon:yes gene_type:complete